MLSLSLKRWNLKKLRQHWSRKSSPDRQRPMVHANEVNNVYERVNEYSYKMRCNQQGSVKYFENQRLLFFLTMKASRSTTPLYLYLLCSSSCCLDATNNTTSIDKGALYTLVTQYTATGTGCPVEYMFKTSLFAITLVDK